MITQEKLAINLKTLKSILPLKPKIYTKEFPKTLGEALKLYCNTRTVNGLQACTKDLSDANWPLPFWFDPNNIKVGFWNKVFYKRQYKSWKSKTKLKKFEQYDFYWIIVMNKLMFKRSYEEIIGEAFDINRKYVFQQLKSNVALKTKIFLLESIYGSYTKKNWIACIITIFPLIDFVARQLLKIKKLGVDVNRICKLFSQNGFTLETSDELMPNIAFSRSWSHKSGMPFFSDDRREWFHKMLQYDFGIIGPA